MPIPTGAVNSSNPSLKTVSLVSARLMTIRYGVLDIVTSSSRTHAVDPFGRSGSLIRNQPTRCSTIGIVIG